MLSNHAIIWVREIQQINSIKEFIFIYTHGWVYGLLIPTPVLSSSTLEVNPTILLIVPRTIFPDDSFGITGDPSIDLTVTAMGPKLQDKTKSCTFLRQNQTLNLQL